MRPWLLATLIIAMLAIPAYAGGNGHGSEPSDGEAQDAANRGQSRTRHAQEDPARADRWSHLSADQQDKGLKAAESAGLFSKWAVDPVGATGRHLSFTIDERTGAVGQVTSPERNGTTFLAGVLATPPSPVEVTARGSLLRVEGDTFTLSAHNNPTGGMRWQANQSIEVVFTLAPGAILGTADNRSVVVVQGTRHAHILTNGAIAPAIVNGTPIKVRVLLQAGESASFRIHPLKGGDTLHTENALFTKGKLGAQLRIADAGGVAAEDGTEFDVKAKTRDISKGRIVVDVSSEQGEGRVIVLAVGSDTLDPGAELVVTMNGTVLAKGEQATLLGGQWAKASTNSTVTVLVYVPHFSSYALAIAQAPASGTGTGTGTAGGSATSNGAPALAPMVALACVIGLALVLRSRREA